MGRDPSATLGMTKGKGQSKWQEKSLSFDRDSLFLFYNFRHFKGGGVSRAIFLLAQGFPLHDAILDRGDLPPFAILDIVVNPTGAEQNTIYKVFVQGIATGYPLAIVVLNVIDKCAISLVLPTVCLTIIIL